jgi:hypothetical protein
MEARLIKSIGDEIKCPTFAHTSTGTFAVKDLAGKALCVMRGRLYALEIAISHSTPLVWHPNFDKASIPGVEIFLA